jgi:hypothetical protein
MKCLPALIEGFKSKQKIALQILFAILFNIFLSSILYQFNNNYRLNIAGDGIEKETFNFYTLTTADDETMTPFKWCFHKSGLVFRGVAQGSNYTLRLFLRARNDTPDGKYLQVKIGKEKIFEGASDLSWRWYDIKIPAALITSDRLWVLIYTKPMIIGSGDSRTVRGLRVSRADLIIDKDHGLLVPSPRHLANASIFLFLCFILFLILKFRPGIMLIFVYSISIIFNGMLLTALKDPLIRGMSWLNINMILVIVITSVIKLITPIIIKYVKLPYKNGDNNWIAVFSAFSIAFKSGLWFIPFTASIDMVFHVHMLEKVFNGDLLNMSRAGNFRFPYPPTFYQILSPFKPLIADHSMLIKIAFTLLMSFTPLIIYLISLRLFKDRRAARYALLFSIVLPMDFYIYMLGIISNGFGHFMMLLSIALTILFYDRMGELKIGFIIYLSYCITALSHFGVMISFTVLTICFVLFLFLFEAFHPYRQQARKNIGFSINPVLFRGNSLRIFTILILALATAFFYYYIRLIIPTLKNIAAMLVANDTAAGSRGFFWLSNHNLLKFFQNIILKFGFFPFIAGITAIILRMKNKTRNNGDMFIFGWFAAFLIQWWLAMKEILTLRFELFTVPLFAITAGWLFGRMKSEKYFKAVIIFCLLLSVYLTILFYSDIERIGSIIIPHKTLEWVLW